MNASRAASILAAICVCLALPTEANAETALVVASQAKVYEYAVESSAVLGTLSAGDAVTLPRDQPCIRQGWCVVTPLSFYSRISTGWVKAADLFRSEGVAQFHDGKFATAIVTLTREIAATRDPAVSCWLEFHIGHAQQLLGELDAAASTFMHITTRRKSLRCVPYAYLTVSDMYFAADDFQAQIRTLNALLSAFPGYRFDRERDCLGNPYVIVERSFCFGDPSAAARVHAIEVFLERRSRVQPVLDSDAAAPLEKATALYEIGKAWEERVPIDPGISAEVSITNHPEASYMAAIAAAPRSKPAGDAAWALMNLPPGEGGGGIEGAVELDLTNYGAFVETYPRHEMVGEALFKIAIARWYKAGYTEVLQQITRSATTEQGRQRRAYLSQWFVDNFFEDLGEERARRPSEARDVRSIFRDIVARYPTTKAAPMAQYYSAVILDYCLHDVKNALDDYNAFLTKFNGEPPFVERAKKRVTALRGPKPY
jgi:hypothetical protein